MSGSLNKVTLIGHLGKDPEIRSFQNGGRAANFSVATSEKWEDKKTGKPVEKTEWHQVSILTDGLVGVAEKYLKKGSKVYIEGRLETREWTDKKDIKRYTTEVVLRPYSSGLILLDSKDKAAADDTNADKENDAPPAEDAADYANASSGGEGEPAPGEDAA